MPNQLSWAYLDTQFSAIAPAYLDGKTTDTVFKSHPLLMWMFYDGNVKAEEEPGLKLVEHISVTRNTTMGWRSTKDAIPIDEQDNLRTAEFPWGEYTGAVSFYERDLKLNQSKAKIRDLIQVRLDQALNTMKDDLSVAFAAGTSNDSAFQILGLKDAVADDTYAKPATYGGLDNTNSDVNGWKATTKASTGLANLVEDMVATLNSVKVFGQEPEIIWTDQTGFQKYEATMVGQIRSNTLEIGDTSFKGLDFRGHHVNWDPQLTSLGNALPTGGTGLTWNGTTPTENSTHRFYFLTPGQWCIKYVPGWGLDNPIQDDWLRPNNQAIRTRLLIVMLQVICKSRRNQGVLYAVPES